MCVVVCVVACVVLYLYSLSWPVGPVANVCLMFVLNQVYRVTGKKPWMATGLCKLRCEGGGSQFIRWRRAMDVKVESVVKAEP